MGNRLRPEDCISLANLGRFTLQLARERLPDVMEHLRGGATRVAEVTLTVIVGGAIVMMTIGPELLTAGGLRYLARLQVRLERQEYRARVIGEQAQARSERAAAGVAGDHPPPVDGHPQ